MEDVASENGQWSPIRTEEENVGSVLVAADGEHSALLGLARGLIVPVVRDDLTSAARSSFVASGSSKLFEKGTAPSVGNNRPPSKASPAKATNSSSPPSTSTVKNAPKRNLRAPPVKLSRPKKSPSNSSSVKDSVQDPLPSKGVPLQGNRPPQKAGLLFGGANGESVPTRGVPVKLSRPPQKGGVPAQAVGNGPGDDLTLSQNGNDLVFTFSDDSEDEASATDSLQSEMDRLRAQMQKLKAGRRTPEPEGGRLIASPETGRTGQKSEPGKVVPEKGEESNGSRPASGGSKQGALSRFAGRLGPLKGGVNAGSSVGGGQNPVKDPPVKIMAKPVPAGLALEEMRKRVAAMEQEVKQGGVKVGRLVPPTVSQSRKVAVDKGLVSAGLKGGANEPAATKGGVSVSTRKNLGLVKVTVSGGMLGVAKAAATSGPENGAKSQPGSVAKEGGPGMKAGAESNTNGPLGNAKPVEKQVPNGGLPSHGVAPVLMKAPLLLAKAPLTSQTVPEARPQSAPPYGRESKTESAFVADALGSRAGVPGDSHQSPNGRARSGPKGTVPPGDGNRAHGSEAARSPSKSNAVPVISGEGQPVAQREATGSPKKRKAAAVETNRALKQPKLEKTSALIQPEMPDPPGYDVAQHSSSPGDITPEVLLTLAEPQTAETGALVVLEPLVRSAEARVTSAERQLAMTTERQLAVMSAEVGVPSAERQLAELADEEERCWGDLRQGEEDISELGRKRDALRKALLEVERNELEARARVIAMRERLEGNRRLRTELELRDRLEKRLREMMNGGGAGSISDGTRGIRDGGLSGGISGDAEGGEIDAAGGRENGSRDNAGVLVPGTSKQGLVAIPKPSKAPLEPVLEKDVHEATRKGGGSAKASEKVPVRQPAANDLSRQASKAAVVGAKVTPAKSGPKVGSTARAAKVPPAVTPGRTDVGARETRPGGKSAGEPLGVKSPGKKARPKPLSDPRSPGQSPRWEGRPKKPKGVASPSGGKVPGASKPVTARGRGAPGAEGPVSGSGGQVQPKVVGDLEPGQKAEAPGKGVPNSGDVKRPDDVSGGQKELGAAPPGREEALTKGGAVEATAQQYVEKVALVVESKEGDDSLQRQGVGRKRSVEGEVKPQNELSGSGLVELSTVPAMETIAASSEPSPKRTRTEGKNEVGTPTLKRHGETEALVGLIREVEVGWKTVGKALAARTAGGKNGSVETGIGKNVVGALEDLEERLAGKNVTELGAAEWRTSVENAQLERESEHGQIPGEVNDGEFDQTGTTVFGRGASEAAAGAVGEKRGRESAEEEVGRKKTMGEGVVGERAPGPKVGEDRSPKESPGVRCATRDQTFADPTGPKATGEKPAEAKTGDAELRAALANPSPHQADLSALENAPSPGATLPDLESPSTILPDAQFGGAISQPKPPPQSDSASPSTHPEALQTQHVLNSGTPPNRSETLQPSSAPKTPNPFRERFAELRARTEPPRGGYESALSPFKSFRLTPQFSRVWGHGLGSLTWSNDVSPDWPLCATELLTGQCAVRECSFQHARDYGLEDEALLTQLAGYGEAVIPPPGKDTTLEQRAAHVVEQLERKTICSRAAKEPAAKNWNEAPIPIYRVGNYLIDHRERTLPTGRGFSAPRAVSSPVLSPGIARPITPGMPFVGNFEADSARGVFGGWRYWERVNEGDKDRESETWEVALQRGLDVVDNNLAIRNTEKLDEALAILARALEENRHVPCLWAVYLELFIRRAKDDGEATQMIEAAVRFNPGSATLWNFYLNTRGTPSDKLRVCQRARSSILASLATQTSCEPFRASAALLDLTLRGLELLFETGDQLAAIEEVRALVAQAESGTMPGNEAVAENGSISGEVANGLEPGEIANGPISTVVANGLDPSAAVSTSGGAAKQSVRGEKATLQSADSERVALLANLSPENSVTLWVSCAYLLAYGRLPKRFESRLGYEQPLAVPEEIWEPEGDQFQLVPGSEVAVLRVFEVASKALSERAALGDQQKWRAAFYSLASHTVAVTALHLGSERAVMVCDRLLETSPRHADLAFRRAALLLGEAPKTNGVSHRNETEVSEAIRCLRTIANGPDPTVTDPRKLESDGERCLALLRIAQLLLTWSSKEAALESLAKLSDDPSNDCLVAVCCCALKAALEGNRSQAILLVEAVNPSLVRTSADVRLVAELQANFAAGQSLEESMRGLTGVLRPGLDNPLWPALTFSPVAPPWADVISEGLRKQVNRAWVSKPASDYDLVNRVVFAWLPQLKAVNVLEPPVLVDILEALTKLVPGNVALSLLGSELCKKHGCESWSIPLVFSALLSARPEPLADSWEALAERCSEAGETKAADEVQLFAKRARIT